MNCETFQSFLQELGKDAFLDLRTRQDSFSHTEACPNCAALLKDEYRLVAGLGALAAKVAHAEASPRVEETLLKAFRARRIEQQAGLKVVRAFPNRPKEHFSRDRRSHL